MAWRSRTFRTHERQVTYFDDIKDCCRFRSLWQWLLSHNERLSSRDFTVRYPVYRRKTYLIVAQRRRDYRVISRIPAWSILLSVNSNERETYDY